MSMLSTEILLIVFKQLHFRQKLECALVCRAWANILLHEGYLFETIEVSVDSTFEKFDNFFFELLKKAKNNTFPGKRCARLLVNYSSYTKFDVAAVSTSFPNLKYLSWECSLVYRRHGPRLRSTTLDVDPLQGWKDSLKTVHDRSGNFITDILVTGVFKNLTTLKTVTTIYLSNPNNLNNHNQRNHLNHLNQFIHRNYRNYRNYPILISALKNAPALTTLEIRLQGSSIEELEQLHSNAPKLISLKLKYSFDSSQNNLDRLDITPATDLKMLKLMTPPDDSLSQSLFFKYIQLKYTSLSEFSYNGRSYWSTRQPFSRSDWSELLSFLGLTLTTLTIDRNTNSDEIGDLMLQNMKSLECLTLNMNANAQLLQNFLRNSMCSGLRSLTLKRLPYMNREYLDFTSFTSLNDINLENIYMTLENIVEMLPKSIKTLTINQGRITCSETLVETHSNIVNLKFYNTELQDKKISNSLTHCFPDLKTLTFNKCRLNNILDLSNHHLRCVEYIPSAKPEKHTKYIKTSMGKADKNLIQLQIVLSNKTRYFHVPYTERHQGAQYVQTPNVSMDDQVSHGMLKPSKKKHDLHYFQLKCENIDTVYFGKYMLMM